MKSQCSASTVMDHCETREEGVYEHALMIQDENWDSAFQVTENVMRLQLSNAVHQSRGVELISQQGAVPVANESEEDPFLDFGDDIDQFDNLDVASINTGSQVSLLLKSISKTQSKDELVSDANSVV
jgi:hypothetical protein